MRPVHVRGAGSASSTAPSFHRRSGSLGAPVALLGLLCAATSAAAQAPNLGTAADFAVLAGSTVTNTGPSVLLGSLGLSPGSAVTGFPPGLVLAPGGVYVANAVAVQAQIDLAIGYNAAASRPPTADLTGRDLGGQVLTPGVYTFANAAQLTGTLTLNALGNPNAVFIFNVGSTLTTGSSSTVQVIGGGTGSNVYWRVGSSATIGSATTFVGDILALTSITLNTGANITCGSALARNGAVTLDTNNISIRNLSPCAVVPLLPTTPVVTTPVVTTPVVTTPVVTTPVVTTPVVTTPVVTTPVVTTPVVTTPVDTTTPVATTPVATTPVATTPGPTNDATAAINNAYNAAVNTSTSTGVPFTFPQGFSNLAGLPPDQQAIVLRELNGELSTGFTPTGIQAMNSFLSLVLNPFASDLTSFNRVGVGPAVPVVRTLGYAANDRMATKAPASASIERAIAIAGYDPRLWNVWGGAYGGQSQTNGNAALYISDRSARVYGFAAGVDYRVLPDTVIGFALGGGGTNYALSNSMGGGRSDMFQSAVYGSTRFGAGYVSAALAYAWHDVTTEQYLVLGDRLAARYNANNIGGRIEGGYRFAIPAVAMVPSFGITPYAALQGQVLYTPSYSEDPTSPYARSYDKRTATGFRTELGAWFDQSNALADGQVLTFRSRAAWAHDEVTDPLVNATFSALPGYSFMVQGAPMPTDLLLASAGAELWFQNGFSVLAQFDGEFANGTTRYGGTGRLRYSW